MTRTKTFRSENFSFLQANLQYALIAIGVGLLVSLFRSVAEMKIIAVKHILMNILFSVNITLSITNSVLLSEFFWRGNKIKIWHFTLIYYSCNIFGMFIGIEASYAFVSLFFGDPFRFLQHYDDYRLCFIIVLIVGTIIYTYRAQRSAMKAKIQEKELDLANLKQLKTQAELQTLQSKINPHFLYNALNSIASLIHEDAEKAEDMTLKLSRLFRYSINSPQDNMATVKEEMEIVNTYLDIEKIRFGSRISFESTVDEHLLNKSIPRFLIQPLVENALKHGLNNVAEGGLLKTAITQQDARIAIAITDNGKPFIDDMSVGYGLQSTYDKLNLLYGDQYEVHISNSPQKHIKILIPLSA